MRRTLKVKKAFAKRIEKKELNITLDRNVLSIHRQEESHCSGIPSHPGLHPLLPRPVSPQASLIAVLPVS
jgi:hypothetical protein